MPVRNLQSEDGLIGSEEERDTLLMRIVALEREVMKMRRTEKVLYEMEQRYLALMDSGVFLYMLLSPSGMFRRMNRRAEEFLGFQLGFGMEVTLQSLSGPGYTGEVEFVLKDAMRKAIHVTLPVIRADGMLGWLDMELSCTRWQGVPVIQGIATDVTELIRGRTELPVPSDYGPAYALQMLSSCPGLLCFAVDRGGILLYATRGYRELARRFLGHECEVGLVYPSGIETAFDMELHELIEEACDGNTGVTTLAEKGEGGGNRWSVTVAPLLSSQGNVVGAVTYLTSLLKDIWDSAPLAALPSDGDVTGDRCALQLEMLNVIPKMCVVLDEEGRCIEVNSCFLRTMKLERENIVENKFSELAAASDTPGGDLEAGVLQLVRGSPSGDLECRIRTRDEEILCLELKGAPVTWDGHSATLVTCTDITRLRRTEEQLRRMSTMDGTGILNRQGMERVLETELERALRYRGSLSLIIFDIDGFRSLNARVGYAAGDRVLRDLAAIFRSRIRATDFLGRWGSDEFMLLTPSALNVACHLAEQLRDMTEHQVFGEGIHLTLSVGIAELRKGMDISALVACACDALTEAQNAGGNRLLSARELILAETATGDGML